MPALTRSIMTRYVIVSPITGPSRLAAAFETLLGNRPVLLRFRDVHLIDRVRLAQMKPAACLSSKASYSITAARETLTRRCDQAVSAASRSTALRGAWTRRRRAALVRERRSHAGRLPTLQRPRGYRGTHQRVWRGRYRIEPTSRSRADQCATNLSAVIPGRGPVGPRARNP